MADNQNTGEEAEAALSAGDRDSDPSGDEANTNAEEEPGVIEISENDKNAVELDFQHCKIAKIENLEQLSSIESLGLRWNFITKIENHVIMH